MSPVEAFAQSLDGVPGDGLAAAMELLRTLESLAAADEYEGRLSGEEAAGRVRITQLARALVSRDAETLRQLHLAGLERQEVRHGD